MTIVIGLLGPAGAGKTTVAEYLVERYGAVRYSLSAPLKEFAKNALEFSDEQLYGSQAAKEAPDPRYGDKSARWFLQRLGTEGGRKTFGEGFWTDQCLAKIEREIPDLAVIDDVRFVSEAKAIRRINYDFIDTVTPKRSHTGKGYIWRLENPDRESIADATHASEAEWTKATYDYVLAPLGRGIPLLKTLVDDACKHFILFPKRPELPL